MYNQVKLEDVLFIDIETVPQHYRFNDLNPVMQELWSDKTRFLQQREESDAETIYEKAGIYAEFGKVICISVGYVHQTAEKKVFRLTSFAGDNEEEVLENFASLLNSRYSAAQFAFCGHNIKEFDIPYLCRRMLINAIPLPKILNIAGKKPWEVNHLDTMEMWKFGDFKHYTSLNLLANIFGIPTPKDDISGADVARVYYEEKNLEKIVRYCEKDVVAVVQLFLKFRGEKLIEEKNIVVV